LARDNVTDQRGRTVVVEHDVLKFDNVLIAQHGMPMRLKIDCHQAVGNRRVAFIERVAVNQFGTEKIALDGVEVVRHLSLAVDFATQRFLIEDFGINPLLDLSNDLIVRHVFAVFGWNGGLDIVKRQHGVTHTRQRYAALFLGAAADKGRPETKCEGAKKIFFYFNSNTRLFADSECLKVRKKNCNIVKNT
jgi:hypothetical protein